MKSRIEMEKEMNEKWIVICKETEISHSVFSDKKEAEKEADRMTKYHNRKYIAIEYISTDIQGGERIIEWDLEYCGDLCKFQLGIDRQGEYETICTHPSNGGVYVHGIGSVKKIEVRFDGFPKWCPLKIKS